jgi:hypothetical protein
MTKSSRDALNPQNYGGVVQLFCKLVKTAHGEMSKNENKHT